MTSSLGLTTLDTRGLRGQFIEVIAKGLFDIGIDTDKF